MRRMICYNMPKVSVRKTIAVSLCSNQNIVLEETVLGRRQAREHAMKLLYQTQVRSDDLGELMQTYMEEEEIIDSADRDYIEDVVRGAVRNREEIDSYISRHAKGWNISRMPKVDLAIMRLSIYEMLYRNDIPVNVSINEAVEMAKKYSGEQSKTFVNGILGKVWDEVSRQAERLNNDEQSYGK